MISIKDRVVIHMISIKDRIEQNELKGLESLDHLLQIHNRTKKQATN